MTMNRREDAMPQTTGPVTHNESARQFEMPVTGGLAVLQYQRTAGQIDLLHTSVPPEDEGNGHGTSLVRAAFDYARRNSLKVVPTCPFVKAYLDRHTEERGIVAAA
jgi:predicted GNAT family acetyltransferase